MLNDNFFILPKAQSESGLPLVLPPKQYVHDAKWFVRLDWEQNDMMEVEHN